MPAAVDLTSRRFGRLVVTKRNGSLNGHAAWLCRCDCGQDITVRGNDLVRDKQAGCGCVSYKMPRGSRVWTGEQIKLLGTDTDRRVAVKLGKNTQAVRAKRTQLSIPAFGARLHDLACIRCRQTITGHIRLRLCERCRRREATIRTQQIKRRHAMRRLKNTLENKS